MENCNVPEKFRFLKSYALAGGGLLAVLVAFLPHLGGLWTAWQTEEYSHGMLIPVLALFIGWHRLIEAKPIPVPSWGGLSVILSGFAFLAVSQLSAFEPPAHYGFVLCLAGLVLSFFGRGVLWTLTPSFIYLLFAIPLPRLIEVALTAKMQILSTTMGVAILQVFGIPVFQDGNIIDLGVSKLQVVEACSGLRYLFPFMSFGFLVAFLFEGSLWKRIVIFLSTIPMTLGMNALRIAVAGVLVNLWGSGMVEGFIHDFEGWVVFALCVFVLLVETWILSRAALGGGRVRFEYINLPSGAIFGETLQNKAASTGAFILCLVMTGILVFSNLSVREEIVPPRIPFVMFPLALDGWHGRQEALDPAVLETLQATDYWNTNYQFGSQGPTVNLFMAYYESQRVGTSAHSPSNCIPGSGWNIAKKEIVPVTLGTISIPVTRMVIRKENTSLLVYYWFDQRGRIINEQYGAKWYLLVDSITKNRTDGTIIRLTTPLLDEEEESAGDARLNNFLRVTYPVIQRYIPQ